MKPKEIKISIAVMRLLRIIPSDGLHSVKDIAGIYSRHYPTASKPRQLINRLVAVGLVKYRLGKLVAEGLISPVEFLSGKKRLIFFKVTPKGEQFRHRQ